MFLECLQFTLHGIFASLMMLYNTSNKKKKIELNFCKYESKHFTFYDVTSDTLT